MQVHYRTTRPIYCENGTCLDWSQYHMARFGSLNMNFATPTYLCSGKSFQRLWTSSWDFLSISEGGSTVSLCAQISFIFDVGSKRLMSARSCWWLVQICEVYGNCLFLRMSTPLSSAELNVLIYRYLVESGNTSFQSTLYLFTNMWYWAWELIILVIHADRLR